MLMRMFIREKRIGAYTYVYLVETVREGGKIKQRIIRNLGRKEAVEAAGDLDRLARSAARLAQRSMVLSAIEDGTAPDVTCRRIGAPLLFERLWQESGCRAVLEGLLAERRFEFAVERAVFLGVLHRLMVSGSDRACEHWRNDYRVDGIDELELHHLYRAMSWLGEELPKREQDGRTLVPRCVKDRIEEELFENRRDLFSELSVVFMDTTTLLLRRPGRRHTRGERQEQGLSPASQSNGARHHHGSKRQARVLGDVARQYRRRHHAACRDRPPAPALCHWTRLRRGRSWDDQYRNHRRPRGAQTRVHIGRARAQHQGGARRRSPRSRAICAAVHS